MQRVEANDPQAPGQQRAHPTSAALHVQTVHEDFAWPLADSHPGPLGTAGERCKLVHLCPWRPTTTAKAGGRGVARECHQAPALGNQAPLTAWALDADMSCCRVPGTVQETHRDTCEWKRGQAPGGRAGPAPGPSPPPASGPQKERSVCFPSEVVICIPAKLHSNSEWMKTLLNIFGNDNTL